MLHLAFMGKIQCFLRLIYIIIHRLIWVWINTYRYIFRVMNIHLPAIKVFTRGTRF